MDVRVGLWRKGSAEELMLLNCRVGEDSWESLGLQGYSASPSERKSVLNIHWKDWCWSWNSNTLATSWEELTHWKRLWWWQGLGAGGEGDDRGWDGWMASPTLWTWVWVNSWSWWWTGRPGMLQFMGLQRVRHDHDRVTELNWTELNVPYYTIWKISINPLFWFKQAASKSLLHNLHAILSFVLIIGASLGVKLVKNPPAMQETLVRFLGWEVPLEKG